MVMPRLHHPSRARTAGSISPLLAGAVDTSTSERRALHERLL
jgi:hypothetical protein